MIGYLKDKKDYYQGNTADFALKRGVAKSGGTQAHYELLKLLITSSIYNTTLNTPLHDTKAAQSILFLFPVNVRIFLALILYKEELNIAQDYQNYSLDLNILSPLQQIEYSTIITKSPVSKRIINTLDNYSQNLILNNQHLHELKLLLNLKEPIDFEDRVLKNNLLKVFKLFNTGFSFADKFIEVAYTNNRQDAAVAICNSLNYNSSSINLILQAIEIWQLETSNI